MRSSGFAMGSCMMRIILARMTSLTPETIDILSEFTGPDCALVLRATDIFGGKMVLGMRVTDHGLETVVDTDDSEPTGDPVEVFREFVTEGFSLEVLLYLPEKQLPPACAFPVDSEVVPGKKAYKIITDVMETY